MACLGCCDHNAIGSDGTETSVGRGKKGQTFECCGMEGGGSTSERVDE